MSYFFISGCARSGTTLLQYMMAAFENTRILPGENYVDCFADEAAGGRSGDENLVAKRNAYCLAGKYPENLDYGDDEVKQYLEKIFEVIRLLNLRVIDIVRDPRDVITSTHHEKPGSYWVDFPRWLNQYREINWLKQRWDKVLRVRYEDLVREPEQVQSSLASFFRLSSRFPFAEFPDFLPDSQIPEKQQKDMKGLRPPDQSNVGRWAETDPERVFRIARNQPRLQQSLEELGYEADESWLDGFCGE